MNGKKNSPLNNSLNMRRIIKNEGHLKKARRQELKNPFSLFKKTRLDGDRLIRTQITDFDCKNTPDFALTFRKEPFLKDSFWSFPINGITSNS